MTSVARPYPILFLDDWPEKPRTQQQYNPSESGVKAGMSPLKKWKLQVLLTENRWGIPALSFCDAYRAKYQRDLDLADHGFETLSEMIFGLPDVFTVQEPDKLTALIFPDSPQDRILHDARLGQDFGPTGLYNQELESDKAHDHDTLIALAWINRDQEFPPDVVLAGEQFGELILPMTAAKIEDTRGVYSITILSAAHPNHFYVTIKSDYHERMNQLSAEISRYFQESNLHIDAYNVPEEFMYPGFPCLMYVPEDGSWERCVIVARRRNNVGVESVDHGGVRTVSYIYLYLMPRKFMEIPRQAILVSLAGIKPPTDNGKYTFNAGCRLRCFSFPNYWLDCLLIEPKHAEDDSTDICIRSEASTSGQPSGQSLEKRKKKKWNKNIEFEVLLCDRNDDEMDILIDEIMVMETYAKRDDTRSKELAERKTKFMEALKDLPRPSNPFLTC